jgi:hypothetical protein
VDFCGAPNYVESSSNHHHNGDQFMAKTIVLKRGRHIRYGFTMLALWYCSSIPSVAADVAPVTIDASQGLKYAEDKFGNRLLDFSQCGYAGADRPIPDVPATVLLEPADGDDGSRIQAAIDSIATRPLKANGFRGAVQLARGHFEVAGQLRISHSGIVLRGSGAGDGGTTIVATGLDRRPLFRIEGVDDRRISANRKHQAVDAIVPLGATKLRLDSVTNLKAGDQILVTRPSSTEWIKATGMDAFGVGWKAGTRDIRWDRKIQQLEGDILTLDAPITTAVEKQFGGATIETYEWPGRIENVGVEDLRLQSAYYSGNPNDEEHAWFGITMHNVQNAWSRRIEFRHFAGGAIALWENSKGVTIQDCVSLEPISEVAGYRRHTFFTQGQLTLFLRCWSEHGKHDFATGHCAPGPNAFVNCYAADALGDSGPLESWGSGVLYDNVRINGAGLNLENRWISPPGAGWSAANCVLWQCQAATIHVFRPPTANNWAVGVWGGCSGNGTFAGRSDYVQPMSLYQAQLSARRGRDVAEDIGQGLIEPIGSTNPTLAEAARFVSQSQHAPPQLIDIIRKNFNRQVGTKERAATSSTPTIDTPAESPAARAAGTMTVKNGWLCIDGALKIGRMMQQSFWRGTVRPEEASDYSPSLTRFVPGRVGNGFTDNLEQVADQMQADGVATYDHHYGLWYDRRRDEHTMVQQANSDVAPPFLEQPIARTGPGTSWNGLNKYDLTKFNPWYWHRLHDFARMCDERNLVLMHENYFQHNILEAGAHWADCPWRPANNVNDTGLPEPPPYIGDKRIFMAPLFYDVSDQRRRALHRGYIRQCLDNFADCTNVIQLTSGEFSGPLEFTQFWIDTIVEWQKENNCEVVVGLSAPKNVQDAILADPVRSSAVDLIDIRYWAYTEDDGLYAPEGGKNLSPRQHLRQTKLKPGGFPAIVKAVREYRERFPNKAVTYYANLNCPSSHDGWAVLMGGGSLPNVTLPDKLARVVPGLKPRDGIVNGEGQWCLADSGRNILVYTQFIGKDMELTTPQKSNWHVNWIDTGTGKIESGVEVAAAPRITLRVKTNVAWLERADN